MGSLGVELPWTKAVESESLKKSKSRKKSDKVGKVGFDFWQKSTSNGDVLNAESQ